MSFVDLLQLIPKKKKRKRRALGIEGVKIETNEQRAGVELNTSIFGYESLIKV